MKKQNNITVSAKLIVMVKPLIGFMVLAVTMGLLGHLCATYITVLGGYAILDYININSILTMKTAFILMVSFAVLRAFFRYGEQTCNHYIAFKILAILRDKVFKALRILSPAKLEGKDKGNLISVITSDIELLEVFYAHTISPVIIALLMSIIMCFYIGSFNPVLGLIALVAYLIIGVLIPIVASKFSTRHGLEFREQSGDLSSFVLDSLRGITEILQYQGGEKRKQEILQRTLALSEKEKHMKKILGANVSFTNLTILFFDLLMLFISSFLFTKNIIDFDGLLLTQLAFMASFGPVVALANLGSTLQHTFAAANRVLNIMNEKPMVEDVIGQKNIDFGDITINDVGFSYVDDEILSNITMKMPKNSIVGIVGKSGSGKSTLLKLIMRFWDISNGSIKISNTELKDINTTNLRNMQSFMTQDTHLFQDSIKNNILVANLNATDEQVVQACKKASIHDFIEKLPNKYETQVGELGDTLSGGEKQRIGLARAFVHNSPLILLDEPTSNLDSLNEAVILNSLNQEKHKKTVVLVSHRASTTKIANLIYNVENGRNS